MPSTLTSSAYYSQRRLGYSYTSQGKNPNTKPNSSSSDLITKIFNTNIDKDPNTLSLSSPVDHSSPFPGDRYLVSRGDVNVVVYRSKQERQWKRRRQRAQRLCSDRNRCISTRSQSHCGLNLWRQDVVSSLRVVQLPAVGFSRIRNLCRCGAPVGAI